MSRPLYRLGKAHGRLGALLLGVVVALAPGADAAAANGRGSLARSFELNAVAENPLIRVDQFGYRPADPKVAVLSDPARGFNPVAGYRPSRSLEVRQVGTGAIVFRGVSKAWNEGRIDPSSGDRGWWFDFSAVRAPGDYVIYDADQHVRSGVFRIAADVYAPVLKAAMRAFFYNRSGHAKARPHADPCWVDDAADPGPSEERRARSIEHPEDETLVRDVRGGWFDAGDTNKYVTFAAEPVHQLLAAYRGRPQIWKDDFNIPESGNGVADILDEVRWEIAWLKRMQVEDGGVLIKVGSLDFHETSPPSADRRPRYYGPVCSSSTIAAAGMFAHAALVFGQVQELKPEAEELQARAVAAWGHYRRAPKSSQCDEQKIKAGDADLSLEQQAGLSVVAAVYLFALTREPAYASYIRAHKNAAQPFGPGGWNGYRPAEGEALVFYATLSEADPAVRSAIIERKLSDLATRRDLYGFYPERDLYRSYLPDQAYHWGSNRVRAQIGSINLELAQAPFAIDDDSYRTRALTALQYLHGVNPLGIVYLSNMYALGAERSVNEIFHGWFADGTAFDNALTSACGPPPGYLVGGPNAAYSGPLSPPRRHPPQKAYRDWNGGWPDRSWEITEPSISYQASYVKLLSKFID
ncbi:Glycosyl hydrolase 9 family protein [Candidatus Defluviicoccus seviourii]|uniref:Glycosyl hydrolase 9 family protein n=1 Tax=Candidatus Defluviicoccus seviourii TaxID=2565273 RepID=A0A564WB86_9PROT|nr:Glycosyl hydrolase 9 family protein [Candidatus Defluviicoccus seviourii]